MGPKGRLDPMEVWQGPCGHLLLGMLGSPLSCTSWPSSLWLPSPTTWLPGWRPSPPAPPHCSTPQTLGAETEGRRGREEVGSGGRGGCEATVWSLWWGPWGQEGPAWSKLGCPASSQPCPTLEPDDPSPSPGEWGERAVCVTWAVAGLLSVYELMRPLGQTARAQDRTVTPHREAVARVLTCIVEVGPGPPYLL